MRFDPTKVWPHPVLRPPVYGDDYPRAEFEVETVLERYLQSTAVKLGVSFELSDPTLQGLVEDQAADFVMLIRSPQTQTRLLLTSSSSELETEFSAGQLAGRVEFSPFLVCRTLLKDFQCPDWHPDFEGHSFDLSPGSVLAEDEPKSYWIDTADESPLGSIFAHEVVPSLSEGIWDCRLSEDFIWISMCDADNELYKKARSDIGIGSQGQYLMNGLYLPAIVSVLNQADQNVAEYEDFRWFSSLDQRLADVGASPIGAVGANRLVDAQKILENPFVRMPLIADALAEEL